MKILKFDEFINESNNKHEDKLLNKLCTWFSDKIQQTLKQEGKTFSADFVKCHTPDTLPTSNENEYVFEFDFDSLGFKDSSVFFGFAPDKPIGTYKFNDLCDDFVDNMEHFLNEEFGEEEFNLNDMSDKNIEYLKNILRKTCKYIKRN